MAHERLNSKSTSVSLSATGTVVTAVPGKRIKVFAACLSVTAALSMNWRDGASTSLGGLQPFGINGGYTVEQSRTVSALRIELKAKVDKVSEVFA